MLFADIFKSKQFLILLITVQTVFIILYALFVRYDEKWNDLDTTRICYKATNNLVLKQSSFDNKLKNMVIFSRRSHDGNWWNWIFDFVHETLSIFWTWIQFSFSCNFISVVSSFSRQGRTERLNYNVR